MTYPLSGVMVLRCLLFRGDNSFTIISLTQIESFLGILPANKNRNFRSTSVTRHDFPRCPKTVSASQWPTSSLFSAFVGRS